MYENWVNDRHAWANLAHSCSHSTAKHPFTRCVVATAFDVWNAAMMMNGGDGKPERVDRAQHRQGMSCVERRSASRVERERERKSLDYTTPPLCLSTCLLYYYRVE